MWQRPVWKFASVTLVFILVFTSVFLRFNLFGNEPDTVLASNIALNSQEVPGLLDGKGEIRVLNVDVTGFTARVICGRDVSNIVQADVDLKARRVTRAQRFSGLFVPELAESQKADAVNIAGNDMRVRQMMMQGPVSEK